MFQFARTRLFGTTATQPSKPSPKPLDESYPLPPPDQADFSDADRNFICALDPCTIYSNDDPTKKVWDSEPYKCFISDDKTCPDTINPSLWRQSQLCVRQGLYRVRPGIYQVRGLDISNMTFVEIPDTEGVVVIDPLCSVETATAGLKLYQNHRKTKVVRAMIYTHSHADHFGGSSVIQAAVPAGGKFDVFAPDGFLEHAVSENVYAGNAMSRRAVYMYGESICKNAKGQAGSGLGMTTSTGASSLVPPTITISEPTDDPLTVDKLQTCLIAEKLEIIFQVTPNTEAPSEMNFYFPHYKALCMAENATHTLHNIQTLRGAVVRDARVWSRYLDDSLAFFGDRAEFLFASHHWPSFGNYEIKTFLAQQRDLYAYMHNETVRLLNDGQTGLEIAEDFELPDTLMNLWNARGYYGSFSHNIKAIYNRYMGWFDGNPAHLWEQPPVVAGKQYAKMVGCVDNLVTWGKSFAEDPDCPDLRFAATILSHAVFADQTNENAKCELANVFEKLGYGAENGTWRNFYLTGAQELRGCPAPALGAMDAASFLALSIEQLMDCWALRINGPEAAKVESFTINIFITDIQKPNADPGVNGYGWHLNMSNGALTGRYIPFVPYDETKLPPASKTKFSMWPCHQQLVDLFTAPPPPSNELKPCHTCPGDAYDTMISLLTPFITNFAIVTPDIPDGCTPETPLPDCPSCPPSKTKI